LFSVRKWEPFTRKKHTVKDRTGCGGSEDVTDSYRFLRRGNQRKQQLRRRKKALTEKTTIRKRSHDLKKKTWEKPKQSQGLAGRGRIAVSSAWGKKADPSPRVLLALAEINVIAKSA